MTSAATTSTSADPRCSAASTEGGTPQAIVSPRRVGAVNRVLGEGGWWSVDEQKLYWVDIKDPAILRLDPETGTQDIWPMPEAIGCCAPVRGGGLVAGLASGFHRVTLGEPGTAPVIELLARPDGHAGRDRFNDGKCHPDGSFWAGTMDDDEQRVSGHYYRLGTDGTCTCIAGPYLVCNGPAFSPDGRYAYLSDSAPGIVHRLDLGDASPAPEPFLRFEDADGHPDGLTTDAAGNLWIAFWDGAQVACFSPQGERLLTIPMPIARPTSCAFGGPDLATLYVTSARTPDGSASPDPGGDLYAIATGGAQGWPAPAYAG